MLTTFRPHPKPTTYRDQALRDMAKDRTPILLAPGETWGNPETTVACHANWQWGGKGQGKKCHDFLSVWGTSAANDWLDQSRGPDKAERQAAFWRAYCIQLAEWEKVMHNPMESRRFRKAAANAINAFIDWVRENSRLFDAGDWQLNYMEKEYVQEFNAVRTIH